MQQKLRQKYLSFLMNRKGTTKLLSGTILLIFFIITFYSFLGDLYGNNTVKANSNSQKIETVDISKKTNLEDGSLSYLADAGEFEIGNDPTVWILIILFNLAIAIAIERSWYLFKNRGQNDKLMDIITNSLSEDPNDSKNLVKKIGNKKFGLEGRVASKTLQGWEFGNLTINEFSKAAMESERRGLEKRLVFLSTLGNNAPFIGLLGTVLGIMKAFRDLATMGDAGPAIVMAGISEALVATAFGLGVAIPCVIIFNIFTKQVKNKLSNAEEIVKMISGMRAAFEIKINTSLNDDPEKNSKIKKDKNNKEIDKVDLPDLAIEIA